MNRLEELLAAKQERIRDTHRLIPGRTALLVIDMQHGFLDPGASLEVPGGSAIVPNVRRLIEACRDRRWPVIFTEFVYSQALPCLRGHPFGPEHLPAAPGQPTGFGLPSSNCLIGPRPAAGPESAATVPALAPRPNDLVVRAHTYDKFYGTPLDLALRCQGIDRVLVTGLTTDICVNATIIAAATRDYRVIAVTDGMATVHQHLHEACLQIWRNKFARLMSADEALAEMAEPSCG